MGAANQNKLFYFQRNILDMFFVLVLIFFTTVVPGKERNGALIYPQFPGSSLLVKNESCGVASGFRRF